MQVLYDSDIYAVLRFDAAPGDGSPPVQGFEIVDKRARRDIYLHGALAERFRDGVEALARRDPSVESFDEYIAGFAGFAPQPLVLH